MRWLFASILLCSLLTVVPTAAVADAPSRAERLDKLYRRAQFQINKRLFRDAIETFEKALELEPTRADTYYNMVMVGRAMHRCGPIVKYAPGFLVLEPSSPERRDVAGSYRRCVERMEGLATLTVDCPVEGAQVLVDGALYGFAPIQPIRLPRGRYTLRIDHELYEPYRVELRLKEDQRLTHEAKPVARIFYSELMVEVKPSEGVQVFLDDKLVGTTPFEEPLRVRTGRYLARLELPGWDEWVRYITIKRNEMFTLEAELEESDPLGRPEGEKPAILRQ